MNKVDFTYFFWLFIWWYISGWIVGFVAYSGKDKNDKSKDELYKNLTQIRHIICGFIFLCFLYHLIK